MIGAQDIKNLLDEYPQYREKLFAYGFVFSNRAFEEDGYPFYGKWISKKIEGKGNLMLSPKTNFCIKLGDGYALALIGHAYNPFSGDYCEQDILSRLVNQANFFEYFNQLTGVFTLLIFTEDKIYIFGDAAGMQTAFYTTTPTEICIASHANLLGDILGLERDEYIKELVAYKYYPLLGDSLPGDLTPFASVKRVIPNHYVEISSKSVTTKRFYQPKKLELTKEEIVEKSAEILINNLDLIAKKWDKAAISVTGGCDSKTTLSCAKNNYGKFQYFSYISSDAEKVDAEGAKTICEALGLKHKIYSISNDDKDFLDIEAHRTILFWNTGAMRENNVNDVRKRVFFNGITDFDIEVKSWASEIGRAYYSKRFNGRKNFGKITPRKCTTLYKFFMHNRKLVKKTDKVFKEYIQKYFNKPQKDFLPWQEQFFWEFRMSSWNGAVITGEHRYSFDITIPYNNRLLLELLLSAPLSARIEDEIYKDIRLKQMPKIDEVGVSIVNVKHTKKRAKLENLYYTIHSKIPF